MSIQSWEHYFKPEVRSSGQTLVKQGKLSISQPSDTEIIIFVRASTPSKVIFKTTSMANNTFYAQCNCPAGKDGRFCKHVWAGLLATETKNADFFESKTKIEIQSSDSETEKVIKPSKQAQAREEAQASLKAKQKSYRKEQYQKQKQGQKAYRNKLKNSESEARFPLAVEEALQFFSQNGFDLSQSLTTEAISLAKKKLARIFHPDLGGSHEEIIELNRHSEILIDFAESHRI